MAQEKEIKIKLKNISLESFIKRIEKNDFTLEKTINQLDIYFDTPEWYLYNNIAALRLRKVDKQDYSFSFKKVFYLPNKTDHYYIEEIETNFPLTQDVLLRNIFNRLLIPNSELTLKTGDEITGLLKSYNYLDNQKIQKTRKIYKLGGDEIVIDDVADVGVIIELECLENEPLEVIKTILTKSEWERDLEGTSYAWLRIVKGLNKHKSNFEKFITEPDWNVWKQEKKMYRLWRKQN